jgi:gas vesicle protein
MSKLNDLQNALNDKTGRNKASKKKLAAGFLAGSAIGVASGVILAPKSGKDSREKIKGKTQKALNKSKKNAVKAKDKAEVKAAQTAKTAKQTASKTTKSVSSTAKRPVKAASTKSS